MTFWGIEVKPGKPYTHRYNRERLKITQATMSYCSSLSPKKSVVQCNVGNTRPILLCSLLPDKMETCHLDLEFDEENEVVFSVLGACSVHLTGYYLNQTSHHSSRYDDDTDSYGEDIVDTENEQSSSKENDYDHDDSFINDSEPEFYSPSPKSDDGIRLTPSFNLESKKSGNSRPKRLKKKYMVSDSDGDTEPPEQPNIVKKVNTAVILNDNEDKFPISSLFKSKNDVKNVESKVTSVEKPANKVKEKEREKVDGDDHQDMCPEIGVAAGKRLSRGQDQSCDSSLPSYEDKNEKNEAPKKRKKRRIVEKEENILNDRVDQDEQSKTMVQSVKQEHDIGDKLHEKPLNHKIGSYKHGDSLQSNENDNINEVTEKKKKKKKKKIAVQQEENTISDWLIQDGQSENKNEEICIEEHSHEVPVSSNIGVSLQQSKKDGSINKVAGKKKNNEKYATQQEEKVDDGNAFSLPSNEDADMEKDKKKRRKKKQVAEQSQNIINDGANQYEQLETKVKTMNQEHAIGYESYEKPTNGADEQVCYSQLLSNKDGNENIEIEKKKKKKKKVIDLKESILDGGNRNGQLEKSIKVVSHETAIEDELQDRKATDSLVPGNLEKEKKKKTDTKQNPSTEKYQLTASSTKKEKKKKKADTEKYPSVVDNDQSTIQLK
ncbi:PREDICTED: peptidyl-prolyl cis-trans isomerase FKBP43-like isoform X2 [Nelumbo nucifera]|uniref:Peptidyl-prolyl cis-trans isomerase FKBP43-like isoform X2 n=2 Tax=Nelumbo nucifera TaxID=4432 RepID=A0A1U7ZH28_NELNU|nr:PREDICTED: peptidyl-prolyl cis-trans isomerase FKBP43-like isoform X2 [Nelumbo nucifera]DAD38814.1 TPA_asm: hypothetical protein HUJ06_013136 [Nelumbo nucifera]